MGPVTGVEDDGNAIEPAWQEFGRRLSGHLGGLQRPFSVGWAWLCLQGPAEPETLAKQDQPGGTLGRQPPCELWMQPWVGRGLLVLPGRRMRVQA